MVSSRRQREIQNLARAKLVEYKGMVLPVRPKDFAKNKLEIEVMGFAPESTDISGFLMRSGNEFGIGYSEAIKSEGFQNFTVAHELGHYFISDHPEALLGDGIHQSRSGYISDDRFEREADLFATEFLMPWKLIQPCVNGNSKGFQAIQKLSNACESSLIASAIRYAAVTADCVAVIVSMHGKIEFMFASEAFKMIPSIDWLKRGDELPPSVPSAEFGCDDQWIHACRSQECGGMLDRWFAGAPKIEVAEDVVGLGSYGRLLTILFTEWQSEDVEEDELEDDYIDRWKDGRFRKRK